MKNKHWRDIDSPINKNYLEEQYSQGLKLKSLLMPTGSKALRHKRSVSVANFMKHTSIDTNNSALPKIEGYWQNLDIKQSPSKNKMSRNASLRSRLHHKLEPLEAEDQDSKSIYEADQWLDTKKYGKNIV